MLKFNTVEEMVAWVVACPNYDKRFTLEKGLGGGGKETNEYYLSHKDGAWHWDNITISNEIGEALAKVWTTKPSWAGSSLVKFSGARTLAGVLKLLGQNDITKKVAEAKARDKAETEKRRRNSYRKLIKEKTDAVEIAVFEANKLGMNLPEPDFAELLPLLEEEA